MRTLRQATACAVAVIGMLAGPAAAHAATQIDATGAWNGASGPASVVVGAATVNCVSSLTNGSLTAPVPVGGMMPVARIFMGCVGPGGVAVGHNCGTWVFQPQAFPTATTVTGRWLINAGNCLVALPGCPVTYPSPGAYTSGLNTVTLDTVTQTIAWGPLALPYTAAGAGCAGLGVPPAGFLTLGSGPPPLGVLSDARAGGGAWTTS